MPRLFVELIPLKFPKARVVFADAHCFHVDHLHYIVVLDSEAVEHVYEMEDWRVFAYELE